MKIGILADVHSNMEALVAVHKALAGERPDRIIFLGDAVGYGANPNECCQVLRGMVPEGTLGNHDAVCTGMLGLEWFSDHARKAIEWTLPRLREENLSWLRSLDLVMKAEGYRFCHGSPVRPEQFDYVVESHDAQGAFLWMEQEEIPVIFIGHAHVAAAFVEERRKGRGGIAVRWDPEIQFDASHRFIISVGSVGQPRDNDPRACYGVLDTEKKTYISRRVEYDVGTAADKIRSAGLPPILASRLYSGR